MPKTTSTLSRKLSNVAKDAIALLKSDHKAVSQLFGEF